MTTPKPERMTDARIGEILGIVGGVLNLCSSADKVKLLDELEDELRRARSGEEQAGLERDAIRQRVIDLFDGGFTTRRTEAQVAADALRELVGLSDAGPVAGMARHAEIRARERAEAERDAAQAAAKEAGRQLGEVGAEKLKAECERDVARAESDRLRADLEREGRRAAAAEAKLSGQESDRVRRAEDDAKQSREILDASRRTGLCGECVFWRPDPDDATALRCERDWAMKDPAREMQCVTPRAGLVDELRAEVERLKAELHAARKEAAEANAERNRERGYCAGVAEQLRKTLAETRCQRDGALEHVAKLEAQIDRMRQRIQELEEHHG